MTRIEGNKIIGPYLFSDNNILIPQYEQSAGIPILTGFVERPLFKEYDGKIVMNIDIFGDILSDTGVNSISQLTDDQFNQWIATGRLLKIPIISDQVTTQ